MGYFVVFTPNLAERLVIAALAVWRLSLLLVHDKSTRTLRELVKVDFVDKEGVPLSFLGRLFACLWCMSLWMGVIGTVIAFSPMWVILVPYALSGAAVIIYHATRIYLAVDLH